MVIIVCHVARLYFKAISRAVPLKIFVERQIEIKILVDTESTGGLVRPHRCHIPRRVAAPTEEDKWNVGSTEEADAICVAIHREVETAQFIARERVGAALEDNSVGAIPFQYVLDYLFICH